MTKNNAKTFELDGITYERKASGYCYRDNARIRSEVFEAAEREADAREAEEARKAAEEAARKAAKEIPGVRKDLNPTATIDGHEYVHDWAGRAYYRDGERISKAEFEAATGGDPTAAKALTARKRRPKDVAFEEEALGVTLTAKQLDFMQQLAALSEDDLLGSPESGIWCDVLCDVIGGQFTNKPMTVGAMLSTICEKGLGSRSKESRETAKGRTKKVTAFCLNDAGMQVFLAVKAAMA